MKYNKLKIIIALTFFLAVLAFSACDGSSQTPEQTAAPTPQPTQEITEPYSEHLELLFMPRRASSEKSALFAGNSTIKFLEEKYNLTFNIINTSSEEDL
jgi:hypothetical protein